MLIGSNQKENRRFLPFMIFLSLIVISSTVLPPVFSLQTLDTKTYYEGTIGQPRRVDPARAYDTASGELIFNVLEPLVRFNETRVLRTGIDTPYNYTAVDTFTPCLADRYTISADGLTWTFHIRAGVKFQDWKDGNGTIHSGDLLTPEDVEYSFERGLVQDQLGSPQWMIYLPLTGQHGSDDCFDKDRDGVLNAAEAAAAPAVLKDLITRDDTARTVTFHLNFTFPETAFLQILGQTWGCIVDKKMAIDYGCWDGVWDQYWINWRRKPTNSYSPLDQRYSDINPKTGRPYCGNHPTSDYPAICGTGPYKLTYWNKATLEYRLDWFPNYWRGWPAAGNPSYLETVIVRGIAEWSTRKMLFLSGDLDSAVVPRANMFELLQTSDRTSPPFPGITLFRDIEPILAEDNIFFTFEIAEGSPYIGTGKFPDGIPRNFFASAKVRQAFAYSMDFDTLLSDAWFGEAIQPATWWVKGLAPDYEDKTLAKYELNLTKVEQLLKEAKFTQGGVTKSVWDWGFTFSMLYNIGNDQRRIANQLMIDAIESLNAKRTGLPAFKISNVAIDWPVFLDAMEAMTMPVYQIGWLADFADGDNWVRPYMYSLGDFAYFQNVTADPNYDTNYIDNLIDEGIKTPNGPAREAIYKELQQLYIDLVPSFPCEQVTGRRWQRDWVQGWYYNALYPGMYFYHIWKATYTAPPPSTEVGLQLPLGSTVPFTAVFKDPKTGKPAPGLLTFIQKSSDNVTWVNIGAAITDRNGTVSVSVTPPLGTTHYRIQLTGFMAPSQTSPQLLPEYCAFLIQNKSLLLVLLPQTGATLKVTTKSIDDIIAEALVPLSSQISDLKNSVSSLTTMLYISIAISVIAVAAAILAFVRKKS